MLDQQYQPQVEQEEVVQLHINENKKICIQKKRFKNILILIKLKKTNIK